jgi:signal peptidase I
MEATPSFSEPEMNASALEQPIPAEPEPRLMVREIVEMLAIVLVIFLGVHMFFKPYQVDGMSMSPYLRNGERLFVNRTAYTHVDLSALWYPLPDEVYPFGFSAPARGDIIVLESSLTTKDAQYIKRIVGMPGETITFREGLVMVDGEPLVEDYIDGAITECGPAAFCSITVPEEHVYVLGDNRMDSEDSRTFGAIPYDDIVGKAIFSNWPFNKIGPIHKPDYGEPAR